MALEVNTLPWCGALWVTRPVAGLALGADATLSWCLGARGWVGVTYFGLPRAVVGNGSRQGPRQGTGALGAPGGDFVYSTISTVLEIKR